MEVVQRCDVSSPGKLPTESHQAGLPSGSDRNRRPTARRLGRGLAGARVPLSLLLLAAGLGCTPAGGYKIVPIPADQTLEEKIVERDPGWVRDRIALIDIDGILMNTQEPGLFSSGENPVAFAVEKLAAAGGDGRVKAVVLRINSPGGTVTSSDILYQEIQGFRKKTGKPVVAHFQDVAASGAYYLACATDEISAQRTCITGSIGVIMRLFNLRGTMNKIGVTSDAIKSGEFKDIGTPFREMRPDERQLMQEMVLDFYEQFLNVVEAGRPKLSRERIRELADGRVYTAQQALDAGLIDRIGTLRQAIERAKELAKIESAHTVVYHRPLGWKPNVYAAAPEPATAPTVNVLNLNLPWAWTNTPGFWYLWTVGE